MGVRVELIAASVASAFLVVLYSDYMLTSTELQGFYYKIRRYNSAQEHSQETQFPITS